jgi:hypothetical protein
MTDRQFTTQPNGESSDEQNDRDRDGEAAVDDDVAEAIDDALDGDDA